MSDSILVEEGNLKDCNGNHKEQRQQESSGLGARFGGMGPVQFNDEYEDIDAYRER